MYYYLAVLLISILRSVIFTYYSNYSLSLWINSFLDLSFITIFSYWLFKQKQLSLKMLVVYLLPLFGSVIWEYQMGAVSLLISLPFLILVYRSKDQLSNGYIKELLQLGVNFVAYPFLTIYEVLKKLKNLAKSASAIGQYLVFITVGIFAGLFIIVVLALLDKDFALWLTNIKQILIFARNVLLTLLSYGGIFLWFFYGVVRTPILAQNGVNQSKFIGLFKIVALIVTALLVSYGLYDTYILLRLFKALSLVYENVGKNTQLYFIEMVSIGGLILFLVSFLLEKIAIVFTTQKDSKEVRVLKPLLMFSSALLLLPLYNLFRALFFVYIPDFGLTARRIFGLYIIGAFLVSYLYLIFQNFKGKNKVLFANVYIWFFASLSILVFVIPSNIIIYKSQLSRYLNNNDGDMAYMLKLNTGKWSGYLSRWQEDKNNANDTLLKWGLAYNYKDLKAFNTYSNLTFKNLNIEVSELSSNFNEQNYKAIASRNTGGDIYSNIVFIAQKPVLNVKLISTASFNTFYSESVDTYNYGKPISNQLMFESGFVPYNEIPQNFRPLDSYSWGFSGASVNVNYTFSCNALSCDSIIGDRMVQLRAIPTDRDSALTKVDNSTLPPIWISSYEGQTYDDVVSSLCEYVNDTNPVNKSGSYGCESKVRALIQKYKLQEQSVLQTVPAEFVNEVVEAIAQEYGQKNVDVYNLNPGYTKGTVKMGGSESYPTGQVNIPERPLPEVRFGQ